MKYLIVYAHPNPKSFNAAIRSMIEERLKAEGADVAIRDLYVIKFDPILKGDDFLLMKDGKASSDVQIEQRYIKESDVIVFIHPIWWFNMPAILKGYIDRVFIHGFAYAATSNGIEGLLKDKKVMIFNTTGGPLENYRDNGYGAAVTKTIEDGIYRFSGMSIFSHKFFYGVPSVTDRERSEMLAELKSVKLPA